MSVLPEYETPRQAAIRGLKLAGFDEIDICHSLGIKRWELGQEGFDTGPWTASGWSAIAERRGYTELVYVDPLEEY